MAAQPSDELARDRQFCADLGELLTRHGFGPEDADVHMNWALGWAREDLRTFLTAVREAPGPQQP